MTLVAKLLVPALLAAAIAAPAYDPMAGLMQQIEEVKINKPAGFDAFRELSFVVDNKSNKDVRFVVIQCDANGNATKPFYLWVSARGGTGFDLANGNLHDPNNGQRGRVGILEVRLDNIDDKRGFKAVDMTDMFGNRPRKNIYTPAHFLVREDFSVGVFQCKDAKGGW